MSQEVGIGISTYTELLLFIQGQTNLGLNTIVNQS